MNNWNVVKVKPRIKHTVGEFYAVYTKNLDGNMGWFPYKHYSTKAAALKGCNVVREKVAVSLGLDPNNLIFKIVWNPYPFCADNEKRVVFEEA